MIEEAMGRFHHFTFVVFFDLKFKILLVRVLDYTEEHGVEITQKKWLQQFVGRVPGENLVFNKNIDGISGATISGNSITESIDRLLKDIEKLIDKGGI